MESIEKGGVGSGIRGHRTIRAMVNGIPTIQRFKVLETLKQERARRDAEKNKPVEKPVDPKVELEKVKVERDKLQAELDKRSSVKPVEKPKENLSRPTRGHVGGLTPLDAEKKIELIEKDLGVDKEQAGKYLKSLNSYIATTEYQDIRENPEKYKDVRDNIEDFIKKAPAWNGNGTIYRGMRVKLDSSLANNVKVGENIDLGGFSSWTSDNQYASSWAQNSPGKKGTSVMVFKMKKADNATSVRHLSRIPMEDEVLLSGDVKLKITGVTKLKKGIIEVTVEENKATKEWKQFVVSKSAKENTKEDQIVLQDKWELDSHLISVVGVKKSLSQQEIDTFIQEVIKKVKEKLEIKEMSKDDWIQAWRDDPHWDKTKSSSLVNKLLQHYDQDPKDLYVLEIGCGNGVDSIAFGKKGAKVIGIDISPEAIKVANENNTLTNVKF